MNAPPTVRLEESDGARRSRMRAHMHAIVAPLAARGLRALLEPFVDPATEQVSRAFPGRQALRAVMLFTVVRRCASPTLRRAVDDGAIAPSWAFELCHLDHPGQDCILALGSSAAGFAAREIRRLRAPTNKRIEP